MLQVVTTCLAVVKIDEEENSCIYTAAIQEFLTEKMFHHVSLHHEYRESNVEAHNLVKAASSLKCGRGVWLTSPLNNLNIA